MTRVRKKHQAAYIERGHDESKKKHQAAYNGCGHDESKKKAPVGKQRMWSRRE